MTGATIKAKIKVLEVEDSSDEEDDDDESEDIENRGKTKGNTTAGGATKDANGLNNNAMLIA